MQTGSDKLKEIILKQYPSIRAFAQEVGIPHGTLVSALNNGVDESNFSAYLPIAFICTQIYNSFIKHIFFL